MILIPKVKLDELLNSLKAVGELHEKSEHNFCLGCQFTEIDEMGMEVTHLIPWPCDTIEAMDSGYVGNTYG